MTLFFPLFPLHTLLKMYVYIYLFVFQWSFFNMCYLTRIFASQKCSDIKQIYLQKESCLLMVGIQIMIHGLEKCPQITLQT